MGHVAMKSYLINLLQQTSDGSSRLASPDRIFLYFGGYRAFRLRSLGFR
ncbi:MAG: hypothetical protein CM1200mP41_18120 [Gammaproteobacteria bacterium]|nr:MAG: hypothetical protein CM1200mP41_18120 [Gammaproteobacteria bacterium]